jgi:hypothetical protein
MINDQLKINDPDLDRVQSLSQFLKLYRARASAVAVMRWQQKSITLNNLKGLK